MIKIAEIVPGTNAHEEFNAGMIYQVYKSYRESDIVFFGHSEYIDRMRSIIGRGGTDFKISFVSIDRLMDIGADKCIQYIYEYGDKLSKSIFCTVNVDILRILNSFMYANDNWEVFVCGHGDIEFLTNQRESFLMSRYLFSLRPRAIASVLMDLFIHMKSYHKRMRYKAEWINEMVKFCKSDNANLFVFSEAYKEFGEKKYRDSVFKRAEFIHLPYVLSNVNEKHPESAKVRIGCTPRALIDHKGYTWRIMKYVLSQEARCNKDFVFSFFLHYHPAWKHVETYGVGKEGNALNWWKKHNDRKHYISFMENCDYILIGYGEDMYILSSSGIMADAVQHETPVFMFQSHCFDDYMAWRIGKRAFTVEEMGEIIISEINSYSYEKMRLYKTELQKCKAAFEKHNINTFKRLALDKSLCDH